jgi:hypothetical protein
MTGLAAQIPLQQPPNPLPTCPPYTTQPTPQLQLLPVLGLLAGLGNPPKYAKSPSQSLPCHVYKLLLLVLPAVHLTTACGPSGVLPATAAAGCQAASHPPAAAGGADHLTPSCRHLHRHPQLLRLVLAGWGQRGRGPTCAQQGQGPAQCACSHCCAI